MFIGLVVEYIMYHVLCGSLSRGNLLFRLLGALRIPETNLEPKLLSMPRTMLPFELPTAIHMGRGSLFVSLFACLFVWMKLGFWNMGDLLRTSILEMKFRLLSEVALFPCCPCGDVFSVFCSLFSFFLSLSYVMGGGLFYSHNNRWYELLSIPCSLCI